MTDMHSHRSETASAWPSGVRAVHMRDSIVCSSLYFLHVPQVWSLGLLDNGLSPLLYNGLTLCHEIWMQGWCPGTPVRPSKTPVPKPHSGRRAAVPPSEHRLSCRIQAAVHIIDNQYYDSFGMMGHSAKGRPAECRP